MPPHLCMSVIIAHASMTQHTGLGGSCSKIFCSSILTILALYSHISPELQFQNNVHAMLNSMKFILLKLTHAGINTASPFTAIIKESSTQSFRD